jgi:Rieske Fe-S protein
VVRSGVGGLVAAIVYPVARYLVPPRARESAVSSVTLPFKASDLAANSGRIFKFGNQPGIVVRTPSGELRAFSARCTHLDCIVQYREDLSHIWCACHDGHYDLSGRNIAGPPPEPLPAFDVKVRGEEIVVGKRA